MNKKGFTLIELLVVVLIIGILAAIALPQYQKAVMKSRLMGHLTTVRSLVQAVEMFYMSTGRNPSSLDDVESLDVALPPGGILRYDGEGGTSGDAEYVLESQKIRYVIALSNSPSDKGGLVYVQLDSPQQNTMEFQMTTAENYARKQYIKPGEGKCFAKKANATALSVCKTLCYDYYTPQSSIGVLCNVRL